MQDLSTNELIAIMVNFGSCAISAPTEEEVLAAREEFWRREAIMKDLQAVQDVEAQNECAGSSDYEARFY